MAYKPRDQYPGFHHVVTRGNNRRDIFNGESDRTRFLVLLDSTARSCGWRVYAYALMRNHYHLVLGVGDAGLAAGMCRLNTAYARWFNANVARINHLFGKRYWNSRIRDDDHFATVVRYVIQNPRRAGIPGPLDGHHWTSYPSTMGLMSTPVQLAKDELLLSFGSSMNSGKERFRRLCDTLVSEGHTRWQPPNGSVTKCARD